MTATLVVHDQIASQLQTAALLPLETAGVVLCGLAESSESTRLIAREIVWVPEADYAARTADSLSIRSEGYVHSLRRAAETSTIPVWLHTHPGMGSRPFSSQHDEIVDRQIGDLFRLRSGSKYYGALIVAPRSDGFVFTGFLEDDGQSRIALDRMWQVGDRFRLTMRYGSPEKTLSPSLDRNVRAFGPIVQQTLGDLRIAIVGCGGTGSAVAEQLVRLGARHLALFDPDVLTASNVTRVYGSRALDVGRPKVQLVSDHLRHIAPDALVRTFQSAITIQTTAVNLAECDVVFGCTDDNAGRLVLSRLATFLVVPVIDCGVLLTSDAAGNLRGIDGRVTTLVPGQACLVCRDRVDLGRAATEALSPLERARRIDEGYAPALGAIEPAVVTFTTAVAAQAVTELLERLIGFGPSPRPSEVILRTHERELSTNISMPRQKHYCHTDSGKLGAGVTEPFLEQTWPNSV